jgi:hypothetical protein
MPIVISKLNINQTSLEVLKSIFRGHPEVEQITMLKHPVEINWRVRCKGYEEKTFNLIEGFLHDKPLEIRNFTRESFERLTQDELQSASAEGAVWSISSKVICTTGEEKHLPMMNFHPEVDTLELINASLKYICKDREGCLLKSGRFYHYYGNFLLSPSEWLIFMSEFLMPCEIVSPRYVGHRIFDGYCTLRLSSEPNFKPQVPYVIKHYNQHSNQP